MQLSAYWKANSSTKKKIYMACKENLRNNDILDPVQINGKNHYFFTFKNHKNSSANIPQSSLMNLLANLVKRISKYWVKLN